MSDSPVANSSWHSVSNFWIAVGFLLSGLAACGWLIFSDEILWNDYPVYQLRYAQAYRFYLSLGIEPLWYPHIEFGMPIGGLVMAQAFHLPAWILDKIPGYWTGSALKIISAKHIILCALSQAALYFALRRFAAVSIGVAFTLSFLLVFQLRTLDAIRYGTFNDAYTYFLITIIAGLHYLRSGSRAGLCIVAIAAQSMITSGYQPIITYGLFAFVILSPLIIPVFLKGLPFVSRIPFLIGALLLGFLFAAPHWMPLIDFLSVNSQRVGQTTIEWADQYSLLNDQPFPQNLIGYFTNLFTPWLSEVHSGFGSSALYTWILLSVLVYLSITIRTNPHLLAIFLAPFIYIAGMRGGLFTFLYYYFPTIKLSRIPGRMGIIIPVVVFVILCALVKQIRDSSVLRQKAIMACKTAAFLVVALTLYVTLATGGTYDMATPAAFYPSWINAHAWTGSVKQLWCLGSVVIGACVFYLSPELIRRITSDATDIKRDHSRTLTGLSILVICIALAQTSYLFRYGSWTRVRGGDTTMEEFKNADHLPLFAEYPFISSAMIGAGYGSATIPAANFYTLAAGNHLEKCMFPVRAEGEKISDMLLPFYLTNEIYCAKSWEEGFRAIQGKECVYPGAVVALEQSPACRIRIDQKRKGLRELQRLNRKTKITELTPHSIALTTQTEVGSVLVTPYPLVPGWLGEVNGKPAELLTIDGGMIGIQVKPGQNTIRFHYYTSTKANGFLIAWIVGAITVAGAVHFWLYEKYRTTLTPSKIILAYAGTLLIAIPCYLFWKSDFDRRVDARLLLHNTYEDLKKLQNKRWREAIEANRDSSREAEGNDAAHDEQ